MSSFEEIESRFGSLSEQQKRVVALRMILRTLGVSTSSSWFPFPHSNLASLRRIFTATAYTGTESLSLRSIVKELNENQTGRNISYHALDGLFHALSLHAISTAIAPDLNLLDVFEEENQGFPTVFKNSGTAEINQKQFSADLKLEFENDLHGVENGESHDDLMSTPLWRSPAKNTASFETLMSETSSKFEGHTFWKDWYQSLLDGQPLDWELQRRVALIDERVWAGGTKAVSDEIARLKKELDGQQRAALAPKGPTEYEKSLVKKSVIQNRDAIVVSTAGLIEQVEDFREKIRGINSLEADLRSDILEFTDYFHQHLQQLLTSLPQPNDDLSEEQAGGIALWLRDYKGVLWNKLAHYSSPENIAEVTVPTGIVLTATGIGAMFGQPLAGAAVGGLITNQMKSSQAAKELLKPTDTGEAGDK